MSCTSWNLRRFLLGAAILAGFTAPTAAFAPDPNPKDKVFVGYLFGQPKQINFALYTHLCHAFVTADADGNLKRSRSVPNRELVKEAHKAGVKVLVSLGGWGWDEQFAAIVSKPEAEDRYAKAVIDLVKQVDYDGIDFDWEYPDNPKEVAGFERLSRRFRSELDAIGAQSNRRMLLTMAATSNPGTLRWLDKNFLLETMDWLNVMTYDFAGDWTNYAGHHSPLFASSKQPKGHAQSTELTMKFLVEERGLPANRLAVGVPLYGRGFAVSEPYASTKGIAKGRVRIPQGEYSHLHTLQNNQGWTRRWDDETKNPWLISPDRSIVIGYDDAESITIKTEWLLKQGFRGIFFWQIAGDRLPDGTNPLQESARKALNRATRTDSK